VGPTPEEIEGAALRARAEAEAGAIRGRAQVDADAIVAAAEADARAIVARAELEAAASRDQAEADRRRAAEVLDGARREAEAMVAEATDLRRRTEQQTLERLLATRDDLHGAIERLTEVAGPAVDLTDAAPGGPSPAAPGAARPEGGGHNGSAAHLVPVGGPEVGAAPDDPVGAVVRSAIGRAVESATAWGRPRSAEGEPARQREELRDGRHVL
jgi:hypothetical protein